MPFGKSTLGAPPDASAVAAARWAGQEGVSTSQLRHACPAGGAQSAVEALGAAHPGCQRAVVTVTPEKTRSKIGTSIAGRTIRVTRAKVGTLYAVAPSDEAWPALWRKDGEEAARLLGDESDAGVAFREVRSARIKLSGIEVQPRKDWSDPTGEKAARAEAEALKEREASEARRKKSAALPIGFGSKKKGHSALFGSSKKKKKARVKKHEPKKRKIVESDDEEEEDGDSVEVASPEEEQPPEAEEEEAPPAPKEEAKPGMKLVEKTYVDPNGYFCTQQVWVKDESGPTKMEISAPKAKAALPKSTKLVKAKPAPKKKLKKGQTSLSSFFGKKK